MKKQLTIAALALAAFFTACKKTDDSSNSAKILGKWNLTRAIYKYTDNGQVQVLDTTAGQPGEYVEFKSDGKMYSNSLEQGSYVMDTANYKITDTRLMFFKDGDTSTLNILSFTSNKLSLYESDTSGTMKFENWIDLSK